MWMPFQGHDEGVLLRVSKKPGASYFCPAEVSLLGLCWQEQQETEKKNPSIFPAYKISLLRESPLTEELVKEKYIFESPRHRTEEWRLYIWNKLRSVIIIGLNVPNANGSNPSHGSPLSTPTPPPLTHSLLPPPERGWTILPSFFRTFLIFVLKALHLKKPPIPGKLRWLVTFPPKLIFNLLISI